MNDEADYGHKTSFANENRHVGVSFGGINTPLVKQKNDFENLDKLPASPQSVSGEF